MTSLKKKMGFQSDNVTLSCVSQQCSIFFYRFCWHCFSKTQDSKINKYLIIVSVLSPNFRSSTQPLVELFIILINPYIFFLSLLFAIRYSLFALHPIRACVSLLYTNDSITRRNVKHRFVFIGISN